jgi:AcrR family transcriptional regulator
MPRTTQLTRTSVTRRDPLLSETAELRLPTQERGARRVEAILDAAAELVEEVGVEAVTVQLLADRAATSKGSLYHFFPDVHSVLRALADRHLGEIRAIVGNIMADGAKDWRGMETKDVIAALLAPLDYLEQNCDLLALIRAPGILPRETRAMEPMVHFVDRILTARYPKMVAERRATRSATLVAVIDGVVGTAARGCSHRGEGMRRELEDLLVIYLDGID